MTQWVSVVFILVVAFNLTLGAPFCVGCWWVFYRYREMIYFRKRRRRLIIGLMLALSTLLIVHPILTSLDVNDFLGVNATQASKRNVQILIQVIWAILVNVMLYMSTLRGWLLHYEKHLNDALKHELWRYVLDPESGDWFVQNATQYGNIRWLTTWTIVPFLFVLGGIVGASAVAIPGPGSPMALFIVLQTLVFVGVSIFFVWASIGLGDFRDFFFVRNEMQAFVGGMISLMIVFIFTQAYRMNNEGAQVLGYTLHILGSAPILCWMIYTMTFQVVSRNSENSQKSSEIQKRLTDEINLTDDQVAILQVTEDWKVYIQENANFKFFIQFLIRAFCVENLLFVAEVVQFKHALSIELRQNIVPGWFLKTWPSELPNPYSSMLEKDGQQSDEPPTNWKNEAAILFQKYIQRDKAPFEINVSHQARLDLESYFDPILNATPEGPTSSRESLASTELDSNSATGIVLRQDSGYRSNSKRKTDRLESVQLIFDKSLKECDELLRDMFGRYRVLFAPKPDPNPGDDQKV